MLKEKLQAEMKEAMKSGNTQKRLTLSLILSAVKSKELDKRTQLSKAHSASTSSRDSAPRGSGQAGTDASKLEEESKLSDEEITAVISSEVKKRKESIYQYEKGGREELAQKERDEMNILMEYMPEQMSEDEVRKEVQGAISQTGANEMKDMGKVIGVVMGKLKGKADGQMVSKIVKEELSK